MKELLEGKKFYEFGQYIKGAISRKICRKRYEEYDLLIKEALEQLIIIKEENMIIDLGEDYLFNFPKYNKEFTQPFIDFVVKAFYNGRKGRRVQFLEKVIYQTEGKIKLFYSVLCDAYTAAKEIQKAYRYAIKCLNMDKIYGSLNELIKLGNPSEKDLFIIRAMLELLNAGLIDECHNMMKQYDADIKGLPLVEFTQWVLHSIKIKSFNAFKAVISAHAIVLERDEDLIRYLDKVAQRYFGQAIIEQEGLSKMIGNMMKMINQN